MTRHRGIIISEFRGWELLTLRTAAAEVDVVPGKGADILAFRWKATGLNVLWTSPWGLPHRGAPVPHHDSTSAFLDQYPGGWQTIFPNGGAAVVEAGAPIGFHGEASLSWWDWETLQDGDAPSVAFSCRLRRTPFVLRKVLTLTGARLEVHETVRNIGGSAVEVMWGHHPAFGAPLISSACRLETAARTFVTDDERDMAAGDLRLGATSRWPHAEGRDGGTVDLRVLPADGQTVERFGYLTDFERGWASLQNSDLALAADLEWDVRMFPHAWLWMEARATAGYPWYRQAYVAAVEPAASWPGQGLHAVREKTGTQLRFEAGETKAVEVSCTLTALNAGRSSA
ncbi:MAG: aldose 1-epimerase [Candidatus Dormibacteria bacterium]